MIGEKKFGIALSGGGYRAAAFHLGTLRKLHDLNLLKRVDVLSTISGGSITGAAFCLHKGDFESFEKTMANSLSKNSVIKFILTSWTFWKAALCCLLFIIPAIYLLFTSWAPLSILPILILFWLLLKYQFNIFPVSSVIEKAYDRFFFEEAKLKDFCSTPELAIGSTNLQTSRPFTFSKRKMEDSFYAYLPNPVLFIGESFPVARAVMASSCVPFAFTPISIDKRFYSDYEMAVKNKVSPKLVDGGVYDNQGVQKITQNGSSYECGIVLVSDAGNKLPFEKLYNNTFTLLLRTVDTFMVRIKNFQMAQNIFQTPNRREVAYQSLGWDIDNCVSGFYRSLAERKISEEVIKLHKIPQEWINSIVEFKVEIVQHLQKRCNIEQIKSLSLNDGELAVVRNVGTNLTNLPEKIVRNLGRHAADLTEVQLRLYCPTLFTEENEI